MEITRRRASPDRLILLTAVLCGAVVARPQAPLSTPATEPYRFIAAHGRSAAIFGYAGRSLEVWGYPFQILDRYKVDFQLQGSPETLDGARLLTRIEVAPDHMVRIWTGPGFEVRETDFVPLDGPDAIVRYQVAGTAPVDIVIQWRPELNLMWPASAGGQEVQWSDAVHGYVISESTDGYKAVLASPEIEAHEPIVNSTRRETLTQSFTLRPRLQSGGDSTAEVYVALVPPGGPDPQATMHQLVEQAAKLVEAAAEDLKKWKEDSLSITTPDEEINRALAWADTDLYQAWACDAKIGCGAVAGFGPSRPMRRPQYDWFFAGDGMIDAEAMLAAGHASRAKEELEFIFHYQNAASGMIWHEISQSAGFLDWAGKYPYLFAHVDLTFQFLSTLAQYFGATGDVEFLNSHWSALHNAFQFCQSLVSPQTGLPQIPAGKMGADEQDRELEDAGLSASWVSAAANYALLASATGHVQDAESAARMSQRARTAFASRYWNNVEHFWISGYSVSGRAMTERRSGPTAALNEHLLPSGDEDEMLDGLAGAAFQTDWGTRSLAADSPEYDPNSYSKGSVSALHTAGTAAAFWSAHRPLQAWQIWSGLISWATMDSPGYMDEVMTGTIFQPQVESVPQQTWSSAGFLSATVHGLLGIDVNVSANHVTLAPHRFSGGGLVKIEQLRAGGALISASFNWSGDTIDASLTNGGQPIHLELAPEIPLGASQVLVDVNGKRAAAAIRSWDEEQKAAIEFVLPHGATQCRFQYKGGVWIEIPRARPQPGDTSRELHVRKVALRGMDLAIDADILPGSSLILESPWKIASVKGGSATGLTPTRSEIHFAPQMAQGQTEKYAAVSLQILFQQP
jgi:glycogen debranching enzyme